MGNDKSGYPKINPKSYRISSHDQYFNDYSFCINSYSYALDSVKGEEKLNKIIISGRRGFFTRALAMAEELGLFGVEDVIED